MKYLINPARAALWVAFCVCISLENPARAFGPAPPVTPPEPTPTPSPTPRGSGVYLERALKIASSSACGQYSWNNRGKAPAGYIKGVAVSFARSLCRLKGLAPVATAASLMSEANTGNAAKDAVAHYASVYSSLRMRVDTGGADTLRSIYTLGLGLGMRESSGNYCEGYDTSAGSPTSSTAEAGLFQASYNSMGASSELRKLYDEYQAGPARCFLEVFKEGASCRSQGIIGSGAGAAYQRLAKSCPAFATEYAMVLLRVLRAHFGPINRKEAEVKAACETMVHDVQSFVEEDPRNACRDFQ